MENLKPFKTLNQQLKILRDKGLNTDTKNKCNSKRELEKIGYYSLVNGYKSLFLKRNPDGKTVDPEQYIEGVDFEELYNLYQFDKELRTILYEGILTYESMLAAKISYYFSEYFPDPNSYLIVTNFAINNNNIKYVAKLINSLSNSIKKNSNKNTAIKHYLSKYGHIPLWVLVNYLPFGDLNYFYKNCIEDIKKNIAEAFERERYISYNKKEKTRIIVRDIEEVNKLLNHFRNAVAHNEITFSKHLEKTSKKISVFEYKEISSQAGVFEVLLSLKLMLRKEDYQLVKDKILSLIKNYEMKFHSIDFSTILFYMNFPSDYKELL